MNSAITSATATPAAATATEVRTAHNPELAPASSRPSRVSLIFNRFVVGITSIPAMAFLLGLLAAGVIIAISANSTSRVVTTFEQGTVADKGWFANLLWRADSSKTFTVDNTIEHPLFGRAKTNPTVRATRANGEVTQYNGDGTWSTIKP